MPDTSPNSQPVILTTAENEWLQQWSVRWVNGRSVLEYPTELAMAQSILGKCTTSLVAGFTPITFTENENRFMQEYFAEIFQSRVDICKPGEIGIIDSIKGKLELVV